MTELSAAHHLASQGHLSDAIQACRVILQSHPENLEAHQAICRFAQQLGDNEELIHQHLKCAEIFSQRKDRDQAIQHYQAILGLGQAAQRIPCELRARIYFEVGEYHREHGQLDLALKHLKKSDELANGLWKTNLALARAHYAQQNYRDALGCFQEAQRLAPSELAPAYEHIAEILLRNRSDGTDLMAFFERAAALYGEAGDLSGARRCRLRLSKGMERHNPEEFLGKACQLSHDGQHEAAQDLLELALRQHPHHAELAFQLAQAYRAGGRDRQASQAFLRVTQLDAAQLRGPACESAADTYRRLKIYPEEVTRLYEKAVQAYMDWAEEEAAARCRHKLLV
jgi:tetratricopeptide (TPR) repeat protein